ncbi:hypothetical protein POM88_044044 [Heracleum sosnowskyi]|uniref:Reverse transcriptase Ty1/copia-type domain-containing protein n=1 Tax=Heracleum sosnowskyi TaxID=360622 RepID=A0AAD8H230_9APIA|nr:hypothetical protein POM88_044044 [Heracleum sosnowskyi]
MSMMGEMSYFLGLQVKQTDDGIFINQSKYTRNLLKRFKMQDCAAASTPIATATKLDPDQGAEVDVTHYRGMIGSLLYLTTSRPDIMFASCPCARFQAKPREPHLIAVKRIFRYLKGTPSLGLWYARESDFGLCGYLDVDFAGCKIDRKKAEYIAAESCCAQIMWMRNQLLDYGLSYSTILIYCDNQSAIAMTGNPVQHSLTKHISIRYHFIRERVLEGTIELHFVPTDQQLADIFNKPLPEATFNKLVNELGMMNFENFLEKLQRGNPDDYQILMVILQAVLSHQDLPTEFHIIQDFLASSPLKFALTEPTSVSFKSVMQVWNSIVFGKGLSGTLLMNFEFNGVSYNVTPAVIEEALHLPILGDSVPDVITDSTLFEFVAKLGYNGEVKSRCFLNKTSNFDALPSRSLKIGYSLIHSTVFDYGSFILKALSDRKSDRITLNNLKSLVNSDKANGFTGTAYIPDEVRLFLKEKMSTQYVSASDAMGQGQSHLVPDTNIHPKHSKHSSTTSYVSQKTLVVKSKKSSRSDVSGRQSGSKDFSSTPLTKKKKKGGVTDGQDTSNPDEQSNPDVGNPDDTLSKVVSISDSPAKASPTKDMLIFHGRSLVLLLPILGLHIQWRRKGKQKRSVSEGIAEGMVPQEPFSQRENEDIHIPAPQEPSSQSEDASQSAAVSEKFPDNAQGDSDIPEMEILVEDTVIEGSTQEPPTQKNTDARLSSPDSVAPDASGAPDAEPILIQPLSSRPMVNPISESKNKLKGVVPDDAGDSGDSDDNDSDDENDNEKDQLATSLKSSLGTNFGSSSTFMTSKAATGKDLRQEFSGPSPLDPAELLRKDEWENEWYRSFSYATTLLSKSLKTEIDSVKAATEHNSLTFTTELIHWNPRETSDAAVMKSTIQTSQSQSTQSTHVSGSGVRTVRTLVKSQILTEEQILTGDQILMADQILTPGHGQTLSTIPEGDEDVLIDNPEDAANLFRNFTTRDGNVVTLYHNDKRVQQLFARKALSIASEEYPDLSHEEFLNQQREMMESFKNLAPARGRGDRGRRGARRGASRRRSSSIQNMPRQTRSRSLRIEEIPEPTQILVVPDRSTFGDDGIIEEEPELRRRPKQSTLINNTTQIPDSNPDIVPDTVQDPDESEILQGVDLLILSTVVDSHNCEVDEEEEARRRVIKRTTDRDFNLYVQRLKHSNRRLWRNSSRQQPQLERSYVLEKEKRQEVETH